MEQVKEGIELLNDAIKALKKPADKDALATLKDTLALIKKQYKAMEKDEAIRIQYQDKVAYSVVQLTFQVLHLLILSDVEEAFVERIITFVKEHDSVYVLANRIKAAAEARADFQPQHRKMM